MVVDWWSGGSASGGGGGGGGLVAGWWFVLVVAKAENAPLQVGLVGSRVTTPIYIDSSGVDFFQPTTDPQNNF